MAKMKTLLRSLRPCLAVPVILLLAASNRCLAMMDLAEVNPAMAKKLGVEIKTQPSGSEAYYVTLEFKPEGELKNFGQVDLEIRHAKGVELHAVLKEKRLADGRVSVGFVVARADVDRMKLRIVTGAPMNAAAYDLRLKEFIGQGVAATGAEKAIEKPAAAPSERVPAVESPK
jgi:hypothetical protein